MSVFVFDWHFGKQIGELGVVAQPASEIGVVGFWMRTAHSFSGLSSRSCSACMSVLGLSGAHGLHSGL